MTKSEQKMTEYAVMSSGYPEQALQDHAIEFAEFLNNNWWEPQGADKGMWVKKQSPWEGGAVKETKSTKELYDIFNQNK